MKKHIPNFITSLNLFCGVLALTAVFRHEWTTASYFIFMAAIFDFLDGFAARMLNVRSELGKQLDSLADLISFGVAPGMILFSLINQNAPYFFQNEWVVDLLSYSALLIPVFSALRLAKFNLDVSQTYHFMGLPTPATGLLLASLPFIFQLHSLFKIPIFGKLIVFMFNPLFLACLGVVLSLLMVSSIPLFSLKFKNLSWVDNFERYIFLGLVIVLLYFLSFLAFPFIILFYLLLSLAFRNKILLDGHPEEV
ncbi:MAG: CDP-diacylglycerol--serine O-phosphatidyltransferase [Bacteroidota bacterium]